MANKVKTKKVKLNPRTKEVLGLTFKSLFSNAAVVEASKNAPWWIGIIFFILGVMLPLIPVMTYNNNLNGGDFLSSTRYTLDENSLSYSLTELVENENYSMEFDNDKNLLLYQNSGAVHPTIPAEEEDDYVPGCDTYPIYRYITHDTKEGEPWNQVALDIYYTERSFNKDEGGNNIASLIAKIETRQYLGGTTDRYTSSDPLPEGAYVYLPSYILFHKSGIYAKVYKNNTTTAVKAAYLNNSNWDNTELTHSANLLDELLTFVNKDGEIVARDLGNPVYKEGVYSNLKTLFNQTYLSFKPGIFWGTSGIYLGIFVGLVLFMGFLLWLLTRGKNNMFNYLSVWTTFKMSFWSTFTPGLIAMVVGFIFTNQSLMIFIMTMGIRVMWLSMKQLRPQ